MEQLSILKAQIDLQALIQSLKLSIDEVTRKKPESEYITGMTKHLNNMIDLNHVLREMAYYSKYERFFKLLNIKIEYTIMNKVTYRPIQVTYPIYTKEFYDFIEKHRKEINTQFKKFMLKHLS